MSQALVFKILKSLAEARREMIGEYFTDQERDLTLARVDELRADVIAHSINPLPKEDTE